MAYKITHPTKRTNGPRTFGHYTVEFMNGSAIVDAVPHILAAYLSHEGYKITTAIPEPDPEPVDTPVDAPKTTQGK